MHYIRRHLRGCGALLALVSCLVVAPTALADTHLFHVSVTHAQITSFTCVNDSCSLAQAIAVGKATSNLGTGVGSQRALLAIDFSPGGDCNIVDEWNVFAFDKGTISTHSHHEDCAIHGLRIDTSFQVTGGTGAFQGATGGGREFASASIIFNGTIGF
jgi:hypothetical protein